jgi:hypothetical protein
MSPKIDLCAACSAIDWKRMLAYDGDDPPQQKLIATPEAQCAICRLISSIRRYLQSHTSEYSIIASDDNAEIGPTEFECYEHWLDQLGLNHSASARCLKLYMEGTENKDDLERFFWTFPHLQQPGTPQIRTKSDQEVAEGKVDYDLITSWISICETEHAGNCNPSATQRAHQVDLFVIDVLTRSIIKAPKDSGYLALSYVCGKSVPNLEGLSSDSWRLDLGTSSARLPNPVPRTIEDAMVVVQKLNQRYLWVDAYCISQFDHAQRAYFISKMDQIYEGAVLTIIAMSGRDSEAGLAGVSTPLTGWPQTAVETSHGKLLVTEVQSIRSVFRDSGWNTRAWTLQEGTLSRRCLCFARNTYFLWCREELFSEIATIKRGPGRYRWLPTEFSRPNCFGLDLNQCEFTMVEFQGMLQAYTARGFTMSSDALNAAVGMLNRVSRLHGVVFSYGMPTERDLDCSLLWTAPSDVRLRRRGGFPSWSWLGWEGKITCTSYREALPSVSDAFDDITQVLPAPGTFRHGQLLSGVARGYSETNATWQADSAIHIRYPAKLEESQELRVTTARAIFPLIILARDRDILPDGEAVGDWWTMIGDDGQSIATKQDCSNSKVLCTNAFRVGPDISSELVQVSSAAEFLLMQHWVEVHQDGASKIPQELILNGKASNVVFAMLVIRKSNNTARRAALVKVDYQYWVQGNPQTVEIVLI